MSTILNFSHKYRLYLYILLFTFTFIFSSLDKFPFLSGVDDKLQFFQHSEISTDNYSKFNFIRNNIEKINENCGSIQYIHCGQWFRVRASSFLNYLYSSKILFLFDRFLDSDHNNIDQTNCNEDCEIIDIKKKIGKNFIDISKKYNYSIFISYLIIFFISIFFVYKSNKLTTFFIFILFLSIIITNHHLINFNLYYFSDQFHKNPKWGTLTELQPKGILVYFIISSFIFYINSSNKLLFFNLFLMILIHWGQALFIQLFFVLVFFVKLFCDFFFEKKYNLKNFFISIILFLISYISINFTYVAENRVDNFLLDLLNYIFSLEFLTSNFNRISFYIFIIFVTFFIIKNSNKFFRKDYKNPFNNFLILGISTTIFIELLFYLNQFNKQFAENEFSLIYERVLGNLYFMEFIFLISLIIFAIHYFALFINDLIFDKKLNYILSYLSSVFIILIVFQYIININFTAGLKQNFDNLEILNDKFNLSYFKKIQYKIENIPFEFFFAICGEKEITTNQEKIEECKLKPNYQLINRYINIDKVILMDEINNLNIDTKRPYVYIMQLNKWYKQQ